VKITLNGRFLRARQTGVQRVATNLILALDRRLAADPRPDRSWELCAPRGTACGLDLSVVAFRGAGRLSGVAWEQTELPLSAQGGRLINLCNVGPLLGESALSMIHDVQVYQTPQSYSPAFVAWYRFALPRLAATSRLLLTVSNYSKANLLRYGVGTEERIVVIPNGADHITKISPDPSIIERHQLVKHRYVFTFGSLQKHKNLGFLLRAFRDRRLENIKLVVSGPVTWSQLGAAHGVAPQPNVLLAGPLSDSEVRALIESAACLALPSSTEGFGLPALEAMTLGCPAVLAPVGALPEVAGTAASYAPLDDLDAWVSAMAELVEDDCGRSGRQQQSRAHASAYTWDRAAAQLLDALELALKH
jgi:glycosyltransferase involved in cell wall biosynthesis